MAAQWDEASGVLSGNILYIFFATTVRQDCHIHCLRGLPQTAADLVSAVDAVIPCCPAVSMTRLPPVTPGSRSPLYWNRSHP